MANIFRYPTQFPQAFIAVRNNLVRVWPQLKAELTEWEIAMLDRDQALEDYLSRASGLTEGGASSAGKYIFGDGSDGAVTISGGTTTLTREMYYTTLTVQSTGILATAGFRVFASTSVQVDSGGVIRNNGSAGTAGVGGVGGPAGNFSDGTAGGAGDSGTGNAGTNKLRTYGGVGGAGGAGTPNAGGAAGTITAPESNLGTPDSLWGVFGQFASATSGSFGGGSGGGAGGGDGTNSGGSGGGGGGVTVIYTPTLTNNGAVESRGGAGQSVAVGNVGGGGGGGGGMTILVFQDFTGTAPDVTGGALGTGNGTGVNGIAGAVGRYLSFDVAL